MITIYYTHHDGETGLLNDYGTIEKTALNERELKISKVTNTRYHPGFGAEGIYWHTTLNKAKKHVTHCRNARIRTLRKQILEIKKLPVKVITTTT